MNWINFKKKRVIPYPSVAKADSRSKTGSLKLAEN